MHELSIIQSMLAQIEQVCRENGKTTVSQIDLRIGTLEHINPEVFMFIFEQLKEGTVAEKAKLNIRIETTRIRCRNCGNEFQPQERFWWCNQCGQVGGEIIQGVDVILEGIYFDDE